MGAECVPPRLSSWPVSRDKAADLAPLSEPQAVLRGLTDAGLGNRSLGGERPAAASADCRKGKIVMYELINRVPRDGGPVLRQNAAELGQGERLEYLTFPGLAKTGLVRHLFTTRKGGVSEGEFASMNVSFTRGDDPERVSENYRRLASVLGCRPEDMVATHQTHTVNVRQVTEADRGKGVTCPRDYEDVDGLVTDRPGIVLVVFVADCVPLYFVDPVHRAVGLAHSGWRGTAAGMGARMVRTMGERFGTRPEDLLAAIGPSICGACYEVSGDVAERFERYRTVVPGREPGKYQLDLWETNRRILLEAGVRADRIEVTDLCTCCNSGYLFSHRASKGRRGALGALLGLL